ncbi:hypothetical protein ACJJTC_011214 [Scirpophaga incertulas]
MDAMKVTARVRVPPFSSAAMLHLFLYSAVFATDDYSVPIEIKLWDSGRTPLAHMVDTTNAFGLKVLAEHNFLNDNNIAFSPYGLMGILVALYEGVEGVSSYQIQRGMHLPWNRNIMRIGFRDIHRTLKTYFVPEEGFLAGLALNNENVTFNNNYKKVLRFYGFDLENDQIPTLSPDNETLPTNSTAKPDITETTTTMHSTEDRSVRDSTTPTMREETTPNTNVETINEVDIRGPVATTTVVSPILETNAESSQPDIPISSTSSASTNQQLEEAVTVSTPISETETSTTTIVNESSSMSMSTIANEITSLPTTPMQNESIDINEVDVTTANVVTSTLAETNDENFETPSATESNSEITVSTLATPTTDTISTIDVSTQSTGNSETSSNIPTTNANETSIETLERRKKSIVDFIFTNPPYVDDYLIYRSYDVGLDLPIPKVDHKMFLANGLKSVQATYMHYDTVLEHAYLPHLEAAALRLPLDSDRYYLLVVLPSRAGAAELGKLLSRMARESDLSDIYSALQPRRIRAVVPSFTVKGHVTLTTDLQKLGIRDVFEPRQNDFTPMTRQPGVYVRSIEQAVSVAIRKYRPDDQKSNRYVTNRQPVTFTATYPFLYFVMDSSIHVALMAGKMIDPLNTRIL